MRRTVVVLAVGALAMSAAACGGDDDDDAGGGDVSAEAQPYVDAIGAQFRTGDESELQLSQEQADCVAPRWVDAIGVDTFEAEGVTPEEITDESEDELPTLGLDESQGNALYDAFEDCDVDVPALLLDSIVAGGDIDDATRDCLQDALDGDLVRSLMVAVVTQGDDALSEDEALAEEFSGALDGCAPTAT